MDYLKVPFYATKNGNLFAYNYNNADMVLSEEEFEESLKRNKEKGKYLKIFVDW